MKTINLLLLAFLMSGFMIGASLDIYDVRNLVKTKLVDAVSNLYLNTEVSVMNHPQIAFEDSNIHVTVCTPDRLIGIINVPVEISGNTKKLVLQLGANIRVQQEVLVALKPILKKTPISDEATELVLSDVTDLLQANKQPLVSTAQLIGVRAAANIHRGDVITLEHVARIPDVACDTSLLLTTGLNGVHVKVPVVALEEGFVGDSIRVANAKTKKIVMAQILSKDEVVYEKSI